jgi:uncharacterized membrane protein
MSAAIVTKPNRSASLAMLVGAVVLQACSCAAVAMYAYSLGNTLAPLFAIIVVASVVFAFVRVWRALDASDEICFDDDKVVVVRRRHLGVERFEFHPYWATLREVKDGADVKHLLIGSHGRAVEVGGFLSDEQRAQLAMQLRKLWFARTREQTLNQ